MDQLELKTHGLKGGGQDARFSGHQEKMKQVSSNPASQSVIQVLLIGMLSCNPCR
jgi:hypothetical protein